MGTLSSVSEGFDMLNYFLTFKEFVYSKFNSDYSRFTHQLKDIISTICNQMRKALDESREFSNTLPPDIDDEIFELILSCLKTGTPIYPNNLLLKHEEIPYVIQTALSSGIFYGLNESLEFCGRNYAAWIAQDTNSIKESLKCTHL